MYTTQKQESNLRDVIHGRKRHLERPNNCSPRSIGSTEFLNPITHEVILSNSTCELKITGFGDGGSMQYLNPSFSRKGDGVVNGVCLQKRASFEKSNANGAVCHKCGQQFVHWEALDSHHLSNHMLKTLARFEDYRETVKTNASILPKKHPRCLADGNELLRFYGTTLACSLVLNGCTSLCVSGKCCVCRIIRQSFSAKSEAN